MRNRSSRAWSKSLSLKRMVRPIFRYGRRRFARQASTVRCVTVKYSATSDVVISRCSGGTPLGWDCCFGAGWLSGDGQKSEDFG